MGAGTTWLPQVLEVNETKHSVSHGGEVALEVASGLLPESTTTSLLCSEGLGQCPMPYLWPVV